MAATPRKPDASRHACRRPICTLSSGASGQRSPGRDAISLRTAKGRGIAESESPWLPRQLAHRHCIRSRPSICRVGDSCITFIERALVLPDWKGSIGLAIACLAYFAPPARAQDVSREDMRANILEQIRAAEEAGKAHAGEAAESRSLRINNHQDTNQPAYGRPTAKLGSNGVQAAVAAAPALKLPSIQFEYASDRLTRESWQTLRELSGVLTSAGIRSHAFLIIGHTDSRGRQVYNLRLSQRRAASVVAALASLGVESARLMPLGMGQGHPLDGISPLDSRNRRVEVSLLP